MPTRLDLIMLVVRDMEASLRFYRDILRLPVAYQSPSWTELGPPEGTHLALYPENQSHGILVRPGSTSLGFYIYDVDGFVYHARSRGARVEREPSNEEFGRYAELRDPDGYLIGLCRPKGMPVTEELVIPATPPAARPAFAQGAMSSSVIPSQHTAPKAGAAALALPKGAPVVKKPEVAAPKKPAAPAPAAQAKPPSPVAKPQAKPPSPAAKPVPKKPQPAKKGTPPKSKGAKKPAPKKTAHKPSGSKGSKSGKPASHKGGSSKKH